LASDTIANALTVDVEDYFQVSAFESRVSRKRWDQYECRVVGNTETLLRIFDDAGVRGTFFLLGWVVDRYPELAMRIAREGHELASHGYWHQLVYDLSREEFADDIRKCHDAIASVTGVSVKAYRAPSFSITDRSLWGLRVLAEQGYQVDSSVFPMRGHDRYGFSGGLKQIHQIKTQSGTLIEFPPTVGSLFRIPLPVGGGYFRIFPLSVTRKSISDSGTTGQPAMFYTHPWEYDPEQPRVDGLPWKSRFRHYTGLKRSTTRLKRLLQLHRFEPMTSIIDSYRRSNPLQCIDLASQ
tara:strand:+ start:56691 stop:57578 length:888 start_codon:yes stop_codon:yes gene_type:complete